MTEEWRDIKGYEGIYQVSNMGRVRSLDRINCMGYRLNGKLMKSTITSTSREGRVTYVVGLCKEGKIKHFRVHRLVAMTFLPNKIGYTYVIPKDGNYLNCRVNNLKWVKYIDTRYHHEILQFDLNGKYIKKFKSIGYIKKYLKLSDGALRGISQCCNKEIKMSTGFIWRYADDYTKEMIKKGIDVANECGLERKCFYCGKTFIKDINGIINRDDKHDFCSNSCYRKYWKRKNGMVKDVKQNKEVIQLTLDGVFIREFGSVMDASRFVGNKNRAGDIVRCCKGTRCKTVSGYKWKYAEDYYKELEEDRANGIKTR